MAIGWPWPVGFLINLSAYSFLSTCDLCLYKYLCHLAVCTCDICDTVVRYRTFQMYPTDRGRIIRMDARRIRQNT